MRDDVDVDERRKAAEQRLRLDRFATIKQFQSETTDDFITRYEREYIAFRTAGNELVQSFMFGDEADARVIQARGEIATRIDGAKKADFLSKLDKRRYLTLLDGIKNGSIDRPAFFTT